MIATLSSPTVSQSDLQIYPAVQLDSELHFGAAFAPTDGEIHVLVQIPQSQPFKKARIHLLRSDSRACRLADKIQALDCDSIFHMNCVTDVPFPSLSMMSNRFNLNDHGDFKIQVRQQLEPLYDRVVQLWKLQHPATVNVSGTIGSGKTHILAVLVLLLIKNRHTLALTDGTVPFICYLTNCADLLFGSHSVVCMMRESILLQLPDYPRPISSPEDIRSVFAKQSVILAADNWNSILMTIVYQSTQGVLFGRISGCECA